MRAFALRGSLWSHDSEVSAYGKNRLPFVKTLTNYRCSTKRSIATVNTQAVSWLLMAQRFRIKEIFVRASVGLWEDESGQDLIEYTLLMAFVALSSAALFGNAGTSVSKIWSVSNTTLSTAALKAAS